MPEQPEPTAYGEPCDWYTVEAIRTPQGEDDEAVWEDAAHIPGSLLRDLLEVARGQVLAFAPTLPADLAASGKCPAAYRLAHLMQTRNLWNAVEVDPGGGFGDDSYTIRPVPLDWIVKQTLRPRAGIPVAL